MTSLGWSESDTLAEWADREFRHLDLIASWETLLAVYDALNFIGPDNDEARLSEFKTVITELNKFLTRMKNGLAKTKDIESAVEYLSQHASTADMNQVRTRPSIAYNKLKQQWIAQSISVLINSIEIDVDEGERDAD